MCQAVKDCLWAFATLNHVPPDIFLSTSEQHCIATLGDFTSQNVANAMWAFQKLGHTPTQQLLDMVDDQVSFQSTAVQTAAAQYVQGACWGVSAQRRHSPDTQRHNPARQLLDVVDDQVRPDTTTNMRQSCLSQPAWLVRCLIQHLDPLSAPCSHQLLGLEPFAHESWLPHALLQSGIPSGEGRGTCLKLL